jgi:hypothetical protein
MWSWHGGLSGLAVVVGGTLLDDTRVRVASPTNRPERRVRILRRDFWEPSLLQTEQLSTRTPLAPCQKCGARRALRGFLPHERCANMRIDFYRCVSCGQSSEEIMPAE